MDIWHPLHPANPIGLLNPSSPLYIGGEDKDGQPKKKNIYQTFKKDVRQSSKSIYTHQYYNQSNEAGAVGISILLIFFLVVFLVSICRGEM